MKHKWFKATKFGYFPQTSEGWEVSLLGDALCIFSVYAVLTTIGWSVTSYISIAISWSIILSLWLWVAALTGEKQLWFKAKRYGYGWYPSTAQGWLFILVVLLLGSSLMLCVGMTSENDTEAIKTALPLLLVLVLVTIWVSHKYGEEAKWRWGKK